jgi:hypothetical protein
MPFVKNLRINNASEEQINKIIGNRDRNLINIKVNSHYSAKLSMQINGNATNT